MHALAVAFLLSVAADPPAAPAEAGKPASETGKPYDPFPNLVPWFVPRTAAIGFFLSPNSAAWKPSAFFRVGWEVAILERPRNHLVVVVDVGSATATSTTRDIRELYQHVAVAGLGYRSTHTLFHWGFHIAAGPVWYRASYGGKLPLESRVLGWTEGRVQLGLKLAPNFLLGVSVGMGTPWTVDFTGRFPANGYLGGLSLGLWADWR